MHGQNRCRSRMDECSDGSTKPAESGERGMTPKVLWEVVRDAGSSSGIEKRAPDEIRRTCARLCHAAGGELEQIQFLLGHASVQTTKRYIGCKQVLARAVNDRLPFAAGRSCGPGAPLATA